MKNGVVLRFLEEKVRMLREKFIIDHGRNPGPGDDVDIPDDVMNKIVVKHLMLTLPVCIQEIGAEGRITEEDALRCSLMLRKTENPEKFFNLLIDMINCWEAGGGYMKGLDKIKTINKKEDIMHIEDFITLLYNKNISLRSRSILGLQGLGGLRVGESLAVQKEKINFNKELILTDLQITNTGILKSPKNDSIRCIPILHDLKPILQEYYLQVGNSKWLFPGRNEKPLHPQTWRSGHYYKLKTKYNIPINREHLLRHGFEKMLYDKGVPEREVKQIMGHKDQTISGWYDRHSPERLVEVTRHIRFREDIPRIKLEGK